MIKLGLRQYCTQIFNQNLVLEQSWMDFAKFYVLPISFHPFLFEIKYSFSKIK